MKLFLTMLLTSSVSFAAEFIVKDGQKLIINGVEAQVRLNGQTSAKTLQINLLEGASSEFEIEQSANEIRIQAKDMNAKSAKKRVIDVQGALPVEIHLSEGQVQSTEWKKDALIHCQKCKIISREGQGALSVNTQKGETLVFNHQGRVEVDSYAASVHIINHNGEVKLENFSGESLIEKSKGSFTLNQNQGSAKIVAGLGSLQFELGKAQLNSQNFVGRLEGQTGEGPINIQMAPESEVSIKSQTGRVTVTAPKGSGTWLNVSTQEGDLLVPSPLRVAREGSVKLVKGRLSGETQKASVFIRAIEASVIIK